MEIKNNLNALNSLPELNPAAASGTSAPSAPSSGAPASGGTAPVTDHATFSSAGSGISRTSTDGDVRMDKVSGIQAALSAGTYNVPPSAVASKIVGSMLGNAQ